MKKRENKKSEKNIILGICGSIAAYKVPELVRKLKSRGDKVTCILTDNGARFVTPLTLQTLSTNKVYEGMFEPFLWDIEHISLAELADIIVVVPATADAISRFANGRAHDLLSSVVLATKSPVLICPAMNEGMWINPITQDNVKRLTKNGFHFVSPQKGELACGIQGVGRLADLNLIIQKIDDILGDRK